MGVSGKSINIRKEQVDDISKVETIIKESFKELPESDKKEHILVRGLRKSPEFIPELSLIAEIEDKLVGYILFSKVQINSSIDQKLYESLALASVCILPEYQRIGIGTELILVGHIKAIEQGFNSCFLIGHKDYYQKFGYKAASLFDITFPFDIPTEYCMAKELVPDGLLGLSGIVKYPEEFFIS